MMSTKIKMLTAAAGAGALLAMGGVTIATSAADPAPPGPVEPTDATVGETSTLTTPPTTPTTPSAVPEIRGPAPLPSELEGVPG